MDRAMDFAMSHLWLSQIAGIVGGLFFLGESPLAGLALIALGILSLGISLSGGPWGNLSLGQRAAVVPGAIGGFLCVLSVIAVVYCIVVAAREEFNRP